MVVGAPSDLAVVAQVELRGGRDRGAGRSRSGSTLNKPGRALAHGWVGEEKVVLPMTEYQSAMWDKMVPDPRYRCLIPLTEFAQPEGPRGLDDPPTPLQCVDRVWGVEVLADAPANRWLPVRFDLEVHGLGRWQHDVPVLVEQMAR
jgi:hypothetical protein